MSLIPKTSHAPFTASHTKLNAKSKTQTPGRKSVGEKGLEVEGGGEREKKSTAKHSGPGQRCGHVAPPVLPADSPPI